LAWLLVRSAAMSSTVLREGFYVDRLSVKSVQPQPELDLRPIPASSTCPGTDHGIKGLLQLCNLRSTCQVSSATNLGADGGSASRIEVVGSTNLDPRIRRLVRKVSGGLRAQQDPEAATEGLGGTYFFMDEAGRKAALMKPCDEEPLAPNNPKGFVGRQLGESGLKPSVKVGEAAMREVAAYILDHDHRAKVPATVLVRASHPIFHVAQFEPEPGAEEGRVAGIPMKLGSLQEFTPHLYDSSEVGTSRFNTKNVHRIGILDLRLMNTDRHAGNLLVRQPENGSSAHLGLGKMLLESNQLELIPIDHGFCLPDSLEAPYFEWLHWPQAMLPFDDEELEYIEGIDPEVDIATLRQHLPMLREECLRMLWVSTLVLKRCARAGLTLSEIGGLYSRPLVGMDEDPSELEQLCSAAWSHVFAEGGLSDASSLEENDTEEESDVDELGEWSDEEPSGEGKAWGVSDSAGSYGHYQGVPGEPATGADGDGIAGRPSGVKLHDSPRSQCAPSPGSVVELQFELDGEVALDNDAGRPAPDSFYGDDRSLSGEADSWSLAAFAVSSASGYASPAPDKPATQVCEPGPDRSICMHLCVCARTIGADGLTICVAHEMRKGGDWADGLEHPRNGTCME